MKTLAGCLVILAALAVAPADARELIRGWGNLSTGHEMRRSQLHRAYCEAALEHALWAARRGVWIRNRECW